MLKMSRWKSSYDYGRRYRQDWEKKYPWLQRAPDNSESAYCKLCLCKVKSKIYNFTKHESTNKHQSHNPDFIPTTCTPKPKVKANLTDPELNRKKSVIKLTVAFACHYSDMATDHLSEILNEFEKRRSFESVKLHHANYFRIIQDVINPALEEDLKEELRGKKFVLIIDESAEPEIQRHLSIVVRYFSEKAGIKNAFLGLLPLLPALDLCETLIMKLSEYELNLEDCVAFQSDGNSSMFGLENLVWTRINELSPNCVPLRCVSNSLTLCIHSAFEQLPCNLGFLLYEIPNWFLKRNFCREDYKSLFQSLHPDHDYQTPLLFNNASETKCLIKGKVMLNMLSNWQGLKEYFQALEEDGDLDTKYKACLLKEMLSDKMNYFYFLFATPVVKEFESVNAVFQSSFIDPYKISTEFDLLIKTLLNRIYSIDGTPKAIENIDYGTKFKQEVESYLNELRHTQYIKEATDNILKVKDNCRSFIIAAINQLQFRICTEATAFKNLSYLDPEKILNQMSKADFADLPLLHIAANNFDEIEQEYRKIALTNWSREFPRNEIPTDTIKFWLGIHNHKSFKLLGKYALNCLLVSASNDSVEQIFAVANAVKTNPKNRLQLHTIEAILRIKTNLISNSICCKDMTVTKRMLNNFKTETLHINNNDVVDASTSQHEMEMNNDENTNLFVIF